MQREMTAICAPRQGAVLCQRKACIQRNFQRRHKPYTTLNAVTLVVRETWPSGASYDRSNKVRVTRNDEIS